MSNPFLTINTLPEEMIDAGRRLAWASGMDLESMDGLLRKVLRWSEQNRLRRLARAGANDD